MKRKYRFLKTHEKIQITDWWNTPTNGQLDTLSDYTGELFDNDNRTVSMGWCNVILDNDTDSNIAGDLVGKYPSIVFARYVGPDKPSRAYHPKSSPTVCISTEPTNNT